MAYIDNTATFMGALMLAFTLNIFAGMRADNVKLKIERIYPPKLFENFDGNKLKDSLFELTLIVSLIYLLKGITDLMKYEQSSVYVVQYLCWIAVYAYLRTAIKNLSGAYPKNRFLKILNVVISFKFKELFGEELRDEIEKIEREEENG